MPPADIGDSDPDAGRVQAVADRDLERCLGGDAGVDHHDAPCAIGNELAENVGLGCLELDGDRLGAVEVRGKPVAVGGA
jgi:hypothetical protein